VGSVEGRSRDFERNLRVVVHSEPDETVFQNNDCYLPEFESDFTHYTPSRVSYELRKEFFPDVLFMLGSFQSIRDRE